MPLANLGLFTSVFLLLGLLDLVINAALFFDDDLTRFLEGVGFSMEAAEVAEETADFFSEAKRLRRCILKCSFTVHSGLTGKHF